MSGLPLAQSEEQQDGAAIRIGVVSLKRRVRSLQEQVRGSLRIGSGHLVSLGEHCTELGIHR